LVFLAPCYLGDAHPPLLLFAMSSSSLVAPGQAAAQRERTVLELMSHLDIYSDPISVRKTGIICTIGVCVCVCAAFLGIA
jgi:hypothetical protein